MATTNKFFRVKNGLEVTGAEFKPAQGTSSYPPILLTAGTNLGTAQPGAFEYDGTNFSLTAASGGRKTIAFTDLIPAAGTSTTLGTIKLFSDTAQTVGATAVSATASRTYGLQINASGQGVVNVPWTDTVYTLPTATASALGGIELFSGTTQSVAANAVTTTASRTYGLQLNSDLQGVINVPWTDTVYTLPAATDTVRGGIELFNATAQSVAANSVTTTASRTYGLQVNADGQGVINVPWTDTNTFPTTWTYTDGTTAGPTASITGTSSTISVAAIPSASATVSGIVTTGTQTFAGTKTLTSPAITTSLTTGSTSFDLVNTTATTVNFAGAGTAVNIGAATGNTTIKNNLIVDGNLTIQGSTTTINTTTLDVEDVEIVLGNVVSASNTTANGGGIRLEAGGDGDKTITWSSTGANWGFSENVSLAAGKTYKIDNANVISGTAAALVVGGGASTTLALGANGGTATILNPTVTLTNATTLNIGGATQSIVGGTVSGTASVFNTNTGTVNIADTATTLNINTGSSSATTLNLGTGGAGTGNAKVINIGTGGTTGHSVTVNVATSTAGMTQNVNIGGASGNIITITGDVRVPSVGTSGFVKLGANGSLSADTNTYVQAASPALTGTPTINALGAIATSTFTTSGTTAGSSSTVFARSAYNGAEVTLKASNSTNLHIIKGLLLIDASDNVYLTQYGESQSGAQALIGTLDFTVTSGNVALTVTPASGVTGTTTYKAVFTLIAV
jgi:hypothetical protein